MALALFCQGLFFGQRFFDIRAAASWQIGIEVGERVEPSLSDSLQRAASLSRCPGRNEEVV